MTVGQAAEPLERVGEVRTPAVGSGRRAALRWEAIQGYGFLFPALLLLLLFHLLPVLYALFLSLFDARVFRDMWSPGPFIGGGNYGRLLTNSEFAQSLGNTVWFAGITVPLGLILAVLFAQLLNARIWGRTGYRVTYFLPYVTSTVAAAVVWRWIFQPRVGVANSVMEWLGLPTIHQDRFWIARIGDQVAGLSTLAFPVERGIVGTDWTAVGRAHRNRGIARALKLETIAQAIELGVDRVRTDNDSTNAPILHLNAELGYRRVFDRLALTRSLA